MAIAIASQHDWTLTQLAPHQNSSVDLLRSSILFAGGISRLYLARVRSWRIAAVDQTSAKGRRQGRAQATHAVSESAASRRRCLRNRLTRLRSQPVAASVCQLGKFGTVRKELTEWD